MIQIPEEVQELFKQDGIKKNLRIIFPNGEHPDLTNENIVMGSFSFTESLCSRNELKFGLCEASVIEFTCAGIPNVKGVAIEAEIEVDCSSLGEEWCEKNAIRKDDVDFPYYPVSYGRFVIDSCERQQDDRLRKIVAYSAMAQQNWEWLDIFRTIVEYSSCYKADPIVFSFSDIKRLLFPEWAIRNNTRPLDSLKAHNNKRSYRAYFKRPGADVYDTIVTVSGYYDDHTVRVSGSEIITARAINPNVMLQAKKEVMRVLKETGAIVPLREADSLNMGGNIFDYFRPCIHAIVPNGFIKEEDAEVPKVQCPMQQKEIVLPLTEEFQSFPMYRKTDWPDNYLYYSFVPTYYFRGYQSGYLGGECENYTNFFVPYRVEVWQNSKTIYDSGAIEGADIEFTHERFKKDDFLNISIQPEKIKAKVYSGTMEQKYSITTRTEYKYKLPDNLRELIEGMLELTGQFGTFTRNGEFLEKGLPVGNGIYPKADLFPSTDIYPKEEGLSEKVTRASYESVTYDDQETKPYARVTITYTSENEDNEKEKTYAEYEMINTNEADEYGDYIYDTSNYQSYSLSENKYVDRELLSEEVAKHHCETVGQAIKNVRYVPATVRMRGLPYLEAGDLIHVNTKDGGFNTYVLRRTLTGIQTLTDTIEAK